MFIEKFTKLTKKTRIWESNCDRYSYTIHSGCIEQILFEAKYTQEGTENANISRLSHVFVAPGENIAEKYIYYHLIVDWTLLLRIVGGIMYLFEVFYGFMQSYWGLWDVLNYLRFLYITNKLCYNIIKDFSLMPVTTEAV